MKTIWLLFTVIFLAFALYHLYLSTQDINKIEIMEIPETLGFIVTEDWPADFKVYDPLIQFCREFNSQIESQNKRSRLLNRISFFAYLMAAFTSVVSWAQTTK